MNKLIIIIFEYNDAVEISKTYSGCYILGNGFDDLIHTLTHTNEGHVIEGRSVTIEEFDEYRFVVVRLFLGGNGKDIIDSLNNLYEEFSYDKIVHPDLGEYEYYIQISSEYIIDEIDDIKRHISEITGHKYIISKYEYIYEWGASQFEINYIIGLASNLTVVLAKWIKNKLSKYTEANVKTFKVPNKVIDIIVRNAKVDKNNLVLVKYYKNEDGKEMYVFSTIYTKYYVQVDENNKITNFESQKRVGD